MSYKDKGKQKEATKERVRRYRKTHKGVTLEEGVTTASTPEGVTGGQGVTKGVTLTIKGKVYHLDDKDVPPIVHALADPVERDKMRKVVASLDQEIHGLGGKKENMLDLVRRGIGERSVTMREVKRLLEAF